MAHVHPTGGLRVVHRPQPLCRRFPAAMAYLAGRSIIWASLIWELLGLVVAAPQAQAGERHVLAADASSGRIALLNPTGAVIWEHPVEAIHDLHLLDNHHVLFQTSWTQLREVDLTTGQTVWSYDAQLSPGNQGRAVEVHAFQRLANGHTMVAESGPARILEVTSDRSIVTEIALRVQHPHVHRDTRLVRQIASGNYLACHEGDGAVREYNRRGEVVWDFEVPLFGKEPRPGHGADSFGNQCFAALRLDNGHTLISTGNGHSILEVTPQRDIVWKLEQHDLPGIVLAWVTTLQILPNQHIVLGNCHAGPHQPQIIEIDRQKQVHWKFQDFERFGDALSNSWVVDRAP